MTTLKKPTINDIELGLVDFEDEVGAYKKISAVMDTFNKKVKKTTSRLAKDLEKYKQLFDAGDFDGCEKLREKYPTDSRFALHLKYVDTKSRMPKFKSILEKHKAEMKQAVNPYVSEFVRLLELGHTKKALKYFENIPDSNEAKTILRRLVKYLQ